MSTPPLIKAATIAIDFIPEDETELAALKEQLRRSAFLYVRNPKPGEDMPLMYNYYDRPTRFAFTDDTITIPQGTSVMVGGTLLQAEQDIEVSTTDVAEAGKDVYIYACVPASGKIPEIVLSKNSTFPPGYTVDNSRKIGGFHCLCANVGTIANHPLSGLVAGNVLPNSVWDLKFRPRCSPEGMVWIKEIGRWVDIYLPSWNGHKLVSQFGGVVADGDSAKCFTGELFEELFKLTANKDLISRSQFQVAAYGSNNHAAISGNTDPTTTGGHVDTTGRRCISNYGLEDATGVYWQWTSDIFEGGNYGKIPTLEEWNAVYAGNANVLNNPDKYARKWMLGYPLDNVSVYNKFADGSTDLGSCWGYLRRAFVGGCWYASEAGFVGSRCVHCHGASASAHGALSGRGAAEPWVAGSE